MEKPLKLCKVPGCSNLTRNKYCDEHQYLQEEEDRKRTEYLNRKKKNGGHKLSSTERGYDTRWRNYSKWFLAQPGNQFCKLHLDDQCAVVAQCVDHIDPPESRDDPRFWDYSNHQPACIHCNSVKGHRKQIGEWKA